MGMDTLKESAEGRRSSARPVPAPTVAETGCDRGTQRGTEKKAASAEPIDASGEEDFEAAGWRLERPQGARPI